MSFRVENLKVSLGNFSLEIPKLDVPTPQVCCIVGESGSGKSTLLNWIAGFQEGEGKCFRGAEQLTLLPPEKRRTAFVFQRPNLFAHLTLEQNITFGLRAQGIEKTIREKHAREWLEQIKLKDFVGRYPSEISEGQAQRVAFARALCTKFPTVLLDEPFSALDGDNRISMRTLLKEWVLVHGSLAFLVTHHEEDALAIGTTILRMHQGKLEPVSKTVS